MNTSREVGARLFKAPCQLLPNDAIREEPEGRASDTCEQLLKLHLTTRTHPEYTANAALDEAFGRALRTMRSSTRTDLAVDAREVERHRQKHITALNVDLGVLYAASVIAESSNLCAGKNLPGSQLYWRDEPWVYARPLAAAAKAYAKMRRKEGIVSSMVTMPKFLEYLHANAHRMF